MIGLTLYIAFLFALAALIFFILRQAASYFRSVQVLFAITFMSFWAVIFFDFIKIYLFKTEAVAYFTPKVAISSALILTIAAEQLALMLYRKERPKPSWKTFLSNKSCFVSALYKGYAILLMLLTWVLSPWEIQQMRNIWGELIYDAIFEPWYLVSLAIVLIAFIGYPCALFLRASRETKQKEIADVLNWYGAGWIGIGLTLIIFHGLLPTLNVQMVEISYLLSIVYFGVIAYAFRKTTILENLFKRMYATTYTTHPIDLSKHAEVFSKALGSTHRQIVGKNILLEIDPASNYERVVQDFATEALANAELVAVFTSKGSAVHSALSGRESVRFLFLTQSVSTPRVDASTNDILLPASNASLLLDALDKLLKARPEMNLSIVFDDLSNLVLLMGFEKVYGFVRYALEMLASENVTSLFLFNPMAHDLEVTSSLRSLFKSQARFRGDRLQVVRLPETLVKA